MLALNALSHARIERVGRTTKMIGAGDLIDTGYELTYSVIDGEIRIDRFVDKRGLCLLSAKDNSHFIDSHHDVIEALSYWSDSRCIKIGVHGPEVILDYV